MTTTQTLNDAQTRENIRNFKPGLWRHYKGGLYTAICLVTHHDTREPMVLYVSHTYGGMNVRPLNPGGMRGDRDGWLDIITVANQGAAGGSSSFPRFEYIGELPSAETIELRDRTRVGQASS